MGQQRKVRLALMRIARKSERPTDETLQYYAMERMLARLAQSPYADQFVLKGGLLVHAWAFDGFRATRDIDLLGTNPFSQEKVGQIFRDLADIDLVDGIVFRSETLTTRVIQPDSNPQGVEVRLQANIDRSLIHLRVDIGFCDRVYPRPVPFDFPALLEDTGPRVQAYTHLSILAEKSHAIIDLAPITTRMKDYYDVVHLLHHISVKLNLLRKAVQDVFTRRGTRLEFDATDFLRISDTNEKSHAWSRFCGRIQIESEPFGHIARQIAAFLKPVFDRDMINSRWDPMKLMWIEE